ncbi:hypothetical protein POTOM_008140 [Populus tomentosa]|uniref:Ternary complex factor MIP1 leucine-zipper domain-containing protein n=1 Tax=Populus tomentosa TaxID=118781 RepID=A0A8X8DBS2_POPTO|nr:hypothetical protein POTOM_008140 [Populus tomentosa]
MNTSARNRLQSMKAPMKLEKEKAEMQGIKPNVAKNRRISSRERKIALQQDVNNLKKQLRHEENIHRALERAFSRPLGALPRLPPYLPRATLELLAEVAVLEEEVVQLEEQIVYFRQDLYQEAVHISSSKRNMRTYDTLDMHMEAFDIPLALIHLHCSLADGTGKENAFSTANSMKNNKGSSIHKAQTSKNMVKRPAVNNGSAEKTLDSPKLQLEHGVTGQENVEARTVVTSGERLSGDDSPNKAFLEHGIPESPEMVVELMRKATINIGGHLLNAITIEHFILRLPYYSKYVSGAHYNFHESFFRKLNTSSACHLLLSFDLTISKGAKNDEMAARNKFGLELSEPLASFSLCCGSWSSPAVS